MGDRHLHAAVLHSFGSDGRSSLRLDLAARARQFSGFVILMGTVAEKDVFAPTHAAVVQNKDDLLIPLICEVRRGGGGGEKETGIQCSVWWCGVCAVCCVLCAVCCAVCCMLLLTC